MLEQVLKSIYGLDPELQRVIRATRRFWQLTIMYNDSLPEPQGFEYVDEDDGTYEEPEGFIAMILGKGMSLAQESFGKMQDSAWRELRDAVLAEMRRRGEHVGGLQ